MNFEIKAVETYESAGYVLKNLGLPYYPQLRERIVFIRDPKSRTSAELVDCDLSVVGRGGDYTGYGSSLGRERLIRRKTVGGMLSRYKDTLEYIMSCYVLYT